MRALVAIASLSIAIAGVQQAEAQLTLSISIRAVAAPYGQPGGTIAKKSGDVDLRPDGTLTFVSSLYELNTPVATAGYDSVAFRGVVEYVSGLPNVRPGLFWSPGERLETIAITEGTAPGTTGGYTAIGGINTAGLGDVVFSGVWEKTTNPTAGGTGIWWIDGDDIGFGVLPTPVVLSGTPAPGAGANFGGVNAGTLFHTARFIAFISGGLGNWTFEKATNQLRRVSYTGMPVDALGTGLTLSNAGSVLGLDDTGRMLLSVQTGFGTPAAKTHLILANGADAITPILSTGQIAPGFVVGTITAMSASVNEYGDVAVSVLLDDGDGNPLNNATALYLWRSSAGELDLITDGTEPLPGMPVGTWGGTPLVNKSRRILMPGLGVIDPYGGPGSTAVFTAIPPIPESVTASSMAFNDLGQVATYVQSPAVSLWLYHPGVGWQKLAKAGEVFAPSGNPNPVVTIRFVGDSGGSDGKPSGLTNGGEVVFTVDGRYVAVARMAKPSVIAHAGTTDASPTNTELHRVEVRNGATANLPNEVVNIEIIDQDSGTLNIIGDVDVIEEFIFFGGTQSGTGTTCVDAPADLSGTITVDGRTLEFKNSVTAALLDATLKNAAQIVFAETATLTVSDEVKVTAGDQSDTKVINDGTIINGEEGDPHEASTLWLETRMEQGETGRFENIGTAVLSGGGTLDGDTVNRGTTRLLSNQEIAEFVIRSFENDGTLRIGSSESARTRVVVSNLISQGDNAQLEITNADFTAGIAEPVHLEEIVLRDGSTLTLLSSDPSDIGQEILNARFMRINGTDNHLRHYLQSTPGGAVVYSSFRFTDQLTFGGVPGNPASALTLQNAFFIVGSEAQVENTVPVQINLFNSSVQMQGIWAIGSDATFVLQDDVSQIDVPGHVTIPAGRTLSVKDAAGDDAELFVKGILSLGGTVDANVRAEVDVWDVDLRSLVTLGFSPGTGIVNGNMTLGPFSTLEFELGGTQQGVTYDHLDVNGPVTIDAGSIDIRFFGGFEATVAPADVFVLVEANAPVTGSFANALSGARYNTSDGLRSFELHYGEGSPHGANRVVATNFAAAVTGPPPEISSQPVNQVVVVGGTATFSVVATGAGPFTYQWYRNGVPIAGATGATYSVTDVQPGQSGSYSVVVTNATGSVTSDAGTFSLDTTPRLINISCLASAGAGDATLVAGFYINGTGSKELLIRGIGPSLLPRPGMVVDPQIRVYDKTGALIASNDDWSPTLAADFSRMGAFGLVANSKDAALKVTLPGNDRYTVHLVNNGAIADGLIEVYDLSRDLGTRLSNVSCRLRLKANETVILGTALIANPVPVLARAIGPGLADYGIPLADTLPDPDVRVYAGSTEIAFNEDWSGSMAPYFNAAGSFPLPTGSKDAATRVTFTQGSLTVHATGKGQTGIAIIELFESPEPD